MEHEGAAGRRKVEELSLMLTASMVLGTGRHADASQAERSVRDPLKSGAGQEKGRQVVVHQGGVPRALDDYARMQSAPDRHVLRAPRGGFLAAQDAESIGRASVALGAGRNRVDDTIDPGVGIVLQAARGAEVRAGEPILEIHYRRTADLESALDLLQHAIVLADAPPPPGRLVIEEIV